MFQQRRPLYTWYASFDGCKPANLHFIVYNMLTEDLMVLMMDPKVLTWYIIAYVNNSFTIISGAFATQNLSY